MPLQGGEQRVLKTLYDLQGETPTSIDDCRIADIAKLSVEDVRDWIEVLANCDLVDRHKTNNGIAATITAKGRLELRLTLPSPHIKPANPLDIQGQLQRLNRSSSMEVHSTNGKTAKSVRIIVCVVFVVLLVAIISLFHDHEPDVVPARPTVEAQFAKSLHELASLEGKEVNIGLFIGGPLHHDNIGQLDHLTSAAKSREARLVAVSPYKYEDLIMKGLPTHRQTVLRRGNGFFEHHDVHLVFLLGFENISGVIPNPLQGDDKKVSAKEYLDYCTIRMAQLGWHVYVFGGPDSWVPADAAKRVFVQTGRTIWHGNSLGDDLGAFFDKCIGPSASGPIGPPKSTKSGQK